MWVVLRNSKICPQKIKLQSAEQPDSVLKVIRNRGFSTAHITKLVKMHPSLLLANPERSILAKFEYFNSLEITDAELPSVCSSTPAILGRIWRTNSFLTSNSSKMCSPLMLMLLNRLEKNHGSFSTIWERLSPKLAVLRELGMPEHFVALILTCYAPIVLQKREKFDKNVKKVIEMGFDPQKCGFIHAMQVFVSKSQSTLEHKFDIFRGWGWTDEDIMLVFRKCPNCMNASESKIMNGMGFLVNKMGWQSADIALFPDVFHLSLEKMVIPRCLVIKVLQSKGLVKKNLALSPCVKPVEKLFLDRFVTKYLDQVPELMNIYQKKEGFEALDMNIYISSSKL